MQRQYNAEMEQLLARLGRGETVFCPAGDAGRAPLGQGAEKPSLLLHSCCGPCSSAVLERLTPYFAVTVFFYNPNIFPKEEYDHRLEEQRRLLGEMPLPAPVGLIEGAYEPDRFLQAVRGLETEPEGGKRCERCFALRMAETARICRAQRYDLFASTLTVSPHKNADQVNRACEEAALAEGVRSLPADFKKRAGYLRSIALSKEYGLYRQDYCGCPFARQTSETK